MQADGSPKRSPVRFYKPEVIGVDEYTKRRFWLAEAKFAFRRGLCYNLCRSRAGVAQLVERHLAKVQVAGSTPVSRSTLQHSDVAQIEARAIQGLQFTGLL